MPIIANPPLPASGFRTEKLLRSGVPSDGVVTASLASYLNAICGRRLKVLCSYMGPATLGLGGFSSAIGHARFYTSANCGGVIARVLLAPSAGTTNGTYYFTVDAYANPTQHVAVQGGSTYGISDFDDLRFHDTELVSAASTPLASSTEYTVNITPSSNSNLIGYILFELPKGTLSTSSDLCVDPGQFAAGTPVQDAQVNDLVETGWALHGHGQHHLYYTWPPNSAFDAPRDHGSTWQNIVDGSSAGWSSSASGFPYWPTNNGRAVSNDIPVVFWTYAKVSIAATIGEVRFVDDDGTLATISNINSSSYAYYTTTGNLNSSKSRRLCIIESRHTTGGLGEFITVKAAGFYQKR